VPTEDGPESPEASAGATGNKVIGQGCESDGSQVDRTYCVWHISTTLAGIFFDFLFLCSKANFFLYIHRSSFVGLRFRRFAASSQDIRIITRTLQYDSTSGAGLQFVTA
jgi:hypothetical protein